MLDGLRVLIVEDDEDSREMLALALRSKGAVTRDAASGETAVEVARAWTPDVALIDLALPGIDGTSVLAALRALPALVSCPAIAISGHARVQDRERSLAAGFVKHLAKPTPLGDIVSALLSVSERRQDPATDVRAMLASLNRDSACQYTSVLRFAPDGTLASVWTYDRATPGTDGFPVGLPIEASYCVLVRDGNATVVVEDARTDPRVEQHPKRAQLATYLGVPIFDQHGVMFGTLCSYDPEPQAFAPHVRDAHEAIAVQLGAIMAKLA